MEEAGRMDPVQQQKAQAALAMAGWTAGSVSDMRRWPGPAETSTPWPAALRGRLGVCLDGCSATRASLHGLLRCWVFSCL